MRTLSIFAASTAMLITTTAYAQSVDSASTGEGEVRSGFGLTEIVVTAQRREESLQNVPVAVTALDDGALEQSRVTNIERLSGLAPNLSVTTQNLPGASLITIRGISTGATDIASDPKAGLYLDGVYIGRTTGSIFDLADIERVEVLRGPQGTLFGRNATAGAISLVTAAPSGRFEGKQLVSYGNFDAFRSRTVLNLPAVGPLSVKLSYLHNEIGGDVRNRMGGQTVDVSLYAPRFGTFTFADELGGTNQDAFQIKARLDFDFLTVDYSYDITDSKSVGRAAQILSTVDDGAGGNLAAGVIGFQGPGLIPGYNGTGGVVDFGTDPLDVVSAATSRQHLITQGHSLTLAYEATPSLTIKNIAAYRKLDEKPFTVDYPATGGLRFTAAQLGNLLVGNIPGVLDPANQPGPNDIFYNVFYAESLEQNQISNELQAIYTGDVFDLTAGLFYFREKGTQTFLQAPFATAPNGVLTPAPTAAIFGGGLNTSIGRNTSYAAYAQATVHISPTFDLTGGIRQTKDIRKAGFAFQPDASVPAVPATFVKAKYNRTNFTVIATYRPTNKITAYAKVATGYVAGGIFAGQAYDPESLTSYEIGLKSQWFDNRLRANFAAFYADYKDLQVIDNQAGVVFTTNAGKARIPGFEIELTALPVENLTLNANLGYHDFKYKEYIQTIGGTPTDVADIARPFYAPKVTLQLGGQYNFPELEGGASPYIRIDSRYRTKSFMSQFPLGATVAEQQRLEPLVTIDPYWMVDGRLGVANVPLGSVTANLSAYVQNLFNVRKIDIGAHVLVLESIYNRPRTYGVELSTEF